MKRKENVSIWTDVLRKVPLSENVEKLRNGALEVFAAEVSRVLSKLDMEKLVDHVLKNYTLRIEGKIELTPKGSRKTGKTKK